MNGCFGYCDGSFSGKSGKGGWGYMFFRYDDSPFIFQDSGGEHEDDTSAPKMELIGITKLIEDVPLGEDLTIYCDNLYVVKSMVGEKKGQLVDDLRTGWVGGWKSRGWKKSDGKEPAHTSRWKYLIEIINTKLEFGDNIFVEHVNSHIGIEGNEIADVLATTARNEFKD